MPITPSPDLIKDTPLHRTTIIEMSDDEYESFIEGLRERRMKSIRDYEEMAAMRVAAEKAKQLDTLDHELNMFEKEMKQWTRIMVKVEKRAVKLRTLRLLID
jgi:hypothetical protein